VPKNDEVVVSIFLVSVVLIPDLRDGSARRGPFEQPKIDAPRLRRLLLLLLLLLLRRR